MITGLQPFSDCYENTLSFQCSYFSSFSTFVEIRDLPNSHLPLEARNPFYVITWHFQVQTLLTHRCLMSMEEKTLQGGFFSQAFHKLHKVFRGYFIHKSTCKKKNNFSFFSVAVTVQLCIFSMTLIFGPHLSLACHRASKSHCAAQHFCLCFRSRDRQRAGRSAAGAAVPSVLNQEVERESSHALQLGRLSLANVCLGSSGVSSSSGMWQQPPGNALTCTASCPGTALQAFQHLPMAFSLTLAQCIDLGDWRLQNGNQEFGIVAAFARICKNQFPDDI